MAKTFVSNNDESVRMFKTDWLNFFSRVDYKVPLFLYVPMVLFFLYLSITTISIFAMLALIALGVMVWTFTEYNLHRFVFHWVPPGALGRKVHFMFHGVHHDYPRDRKRLVMVPAVSLPLAVLFYFTFRFLFTKVFGIETYVYPFFVGFALGYLFYDMTHYALHHVEFKSRFWRQLKQHHMLHHYRDAQHGFGVSTQFWDLVYHTAFQRGLKEPFVPEEE